MDDFLKNLPPHRIYMMVSIVMFAAIVGVEIPGFPMEVPGNLQIFFFFGGCFMMFLSFMANEGNKKRETERQHMDAELRAAKLKAGGDPDDDKTTIMNKGD